jgi:hypothetical protein
MKYSEYQAHQSNLSLAKIEYSAMVTYGEGKKFRTEINSSYTGDYLFKTTNTGRIGMELRKGSPDGEKIGYLASLETNHVIYTATNDLVTIFPVFVFYNRTTQRLTTVKPTSHFEEVGATPYPVTSSNVQTYLFPNDPTVTWQDILASLVSPVAYITVVNNIPNQSVEFTTAGTNILESQTGYKSMGSGVQETFEIVSTEAGTQKNLVVKAYSGSLQIPVKDAEGNSISIKNGYDYSVTITFAGGTVNDQTNYRAVIEEVSRRDISNEIESL